MEAKARRELYAFFSRLFVKEVDQDFLATIQGPLGSALLPEAILELNSLSASKLQAWLDADFTHLTIVNLAPYESFFRRDDGKIEAGAVNPVVEFYRRHGFEADLGAARSISPDHLGIELELMAELCDQEAAAHDPEYAKCIREVESAFLREHLLAWAPIYFLTAMRNARSVLYREGSEAALEFMLEDYERLARVPEVSDHVVTGTRSST
ncbi:MAG: molecular chaperone TorD family protein [Deltaproteobacteria bacterium]|nr:molecular chaperone TorD family protein [Deltaproteobacteria bacterium]